jgi:hypothetical protein
MNELEKAFLGMSTIILCFLDEEPITIAYDKMGELSRGELATFHSILNNVLTHWSLFLLHGKMAKRPHYLPHDI